MSVTIDEANAGEANAWWLDTPEATGRARTPRLAVPERGAS